MSESGRKIPLFPEKIGIGMEFQRLLVDKFKAIQPEISECTFPYLWSWSEFAKTSLSYHHNVLLITIYNARRDEEIMLPPLTDNNNLCAEIIAELLCNEQITAAARIPEAITAITMDKYPEIAVEEEPERADYVHKTSELADLPGQKFHSKKNHINQFEKNAPDAVYKPIDNGKLTDKCVKFSINWLESHPKKHLKSLQKEVQVTVKMLKNYQALGLTGGVLMDAGQIAAFALGEELNSETFVVRVEKADTSFPGSYQAINQLFVSNAARDYKYTNREQDLGVPGLRRAKKSYHPVKMIRKYRLSIDGM